jgi:LysM repeat protein
MKLMKKISSVVLALTILIAGVGFTSQPALAANCTLFHTVRPGETLYSIGLAFGVPWTRLANINAIANPRRIFSGQVLCIFKSGGPAPVPMVVPTISIVSVVKGTSVTIQTHNFPAGDNFTAWMNFYGTLGVGGTQVGTLASGSGASQTVTFNIPAAYAGQARVAIRLQSPTSGFFAFNWFFNNTSGGGTGGGGVGGYFGFPTFTIQAVRRNATVTILTNNYPPNTNFTVRMNFIGTRGIGGQVVGSFNSGTGAAQSLSFPVPAFLAGQRQIAVRTDSPATGFFAYNWFWNNTTP